MFTIILRGLDDKGGYACTECLLLASLPVYLYLFSIPLSTHFTKSIIQSFLNSQHHLVSEACGDPLGQQ